MSTEQDNLMADNVVASDDVLEPEEQPAEQQQQAEAIDDAPQSAAADNDAEMDNGPVSYPDTVEHVVLVKGLNWTIQRSSVREMFKGYNVVSIMLLHDALSRGFVALGSEEERTKACSIAKEGGLHRKQFGKRWLDVTGATPEDFYHARDHDAPLDGHLMSVIKIRNIPGGLSEGAAQRSAIRSLFDGFGLIPTINPQEVDPSSPPHASIVGSGPSLQLTNNVYIGLMLESGKPDGNAYVVFDSAAEAKRASDELQGKLKLGNKPLTTILTHRGELYSILAMAVDKGMGVDAHFQGCVRLKGLPTEATEADIRAVVAEADANLIDRVFMGRRGDNRFSGEAAVVATSEEAASRLLEVYLSPEAKIAGKQIPAETVIHGRGGVDRKVDIKPRLCCLGEAWALVGGQFVVHGDEAVKRLVHGDEAVKRLVHGDEAVKSVLRIIGIPFSSKPTDVLERVKGTGNDEVTAAFADITDRDVFIVPRWDGKPSGLTFICFPSEEAAAAAQALLPTVEFLFPERKSTRPEDKDKPLATEPRTLKTAVVPKSELYWSISRPVSNPGQETSPSVTGREQLDLCLRCKGVPYEVVPEELESFFAGFNPVKVHLHMERQAAAGAAPKVLDAFVEFATLFDAQAALCRNRATITVGAGAKERYLELYPANRREMKDTLAGRNPVMLGTPAALLPPGGAQGQPGGRGGAGYGQGAPQGRGQAPYASGLSRGGPPPPYGQPGAPRGHPPRDAPPHDYRYPPRDDRRGPPPASYDQPPRSYPPRDDYRGGAAPAPRDYRDDRRAPPPGRDDRRYDDDRSPRGGYGGQAPPPSAGGYGNYGGSTSSGGGYSRSPPPAADGGYGSYQQAPPQDYYRGQAAAPAPYDDRRRDRSRDRNDGRGGYPAPGYGQPAAGGGRPRSRSRERSDRYTAAPAPSYAGPYYGAPSGYSSSSSGAAPPPAPATSGYGGYGAAAAPAPYSDYSAPSYGSSGYGQQQQQSSSGGYGYGAPAPAPAPGGYGGGRGAGGSGSGYYAGAPPAGGYRR